MNENNILKPCPFCGGQAEMITIKRKDEKGEYTVKYVKCADCGARSEERTGDRMWLRLLSEEEVEEVLSKHWNRRTCSCKKKEDK